MSSIDAGRQAAILTWRENAFSTTELTAFNSLDYDSYGARSLRYQDARFYYENSVYSSIQKYFNAKRVQQKLYKHIIPIYNPTHRAVEAFVAKVYGGVLDTTTMSGGAIPISANDERILDGLRQLYQWSNMGTKKSMYTRYAAMLGDVAIKIIDDKERGQVRLEFLDPGIINDVDFDAVGSVQSVSIIYQRWDEHSEQYFEYQEFITPESFATFKDGEPFSYDESGQPEWENEYGFVPLVMAKFQDIGQRFGANVIYPAWRKIDALNDIASLLNREIRKSVVQVHVLTGNASMKNADLIGDKENMPFLKLPPGADIKPIERVLNIADTQSYIENIMQEIERDMPELSLHRIRQGGNLTAPGIRSAYDDAIARSKEVRGNLDSSLVEAQLMALAIGGMSSYQNFESFGIEDYYNGNLHHQVKDRPVISDTISKSEKLASLGQIRANRLVLRELGYSDAEIEIYLSDLVLFEQQAQAAQSGINEQAQVASIMSNLGVRRE